MLPHPLGVAESRPRRAKAGGLRHVPLVLLQLAQDDAAVPLAAVLGAVVGNRVGLAVAAGEELRGGYALLDQVRTDRFGTSLG